MGDAAGQQSTSGALGRAEPSEEAVGVVAVVFTVVFTVVVTVVVSAAGVVVD